MQALLESGHGHGRDVGAKKSRLGHVVGRADRSGDDLDSVVDVLAGPVIVLDAGHDIVELRDAVLGDVVKAADKRADVAGTGVGGHQGLRRRENERHVDTHARIGQRAAGGEAGLADGELDHDVGGEGGKALALLDHALGRGGGRLGGHGQALAELGDLEHMGLKVGKLTAGLGVQGRIGGDAGKAAPALGLGDLVKVGGIDKELHGANSFEGIQNSKNRTKGMSLCPMCRACSWDMPQARRRVGKAT